MDLPNEVVLEILSWLPLETVGKMRALSKFHEKATHHSYYKELLVQRQRGPILDGFLFQTLRSDKYFTFSFASPLPNSPPFDMSLTFLPGRRPKILAAAPNGLLLCETQHLKYRPKQPIYSVCKPSTNQYKGIPLPRIRFFAQNIAMFVLRSNPLHFKILRLSENQTPKKQHPLFSITIFELFDSETWRWKRLDDIVRDSQSKYMDTRSSPIMASGSAYWKFNDEISIFAFHFHSETWSRIMMPDLIITEYENRVKNYRVDKLRIKLVEYEGKLGLMREFYNGCVDSMELWVMDNYSNKIWTKKCDLVGSMPMALYGSDISMTHSSGKVRFSNLETDTCKKLEQGNYYQPRMLFPFLSDFELWNFDAPPRALKPRTMAKILRKRLLAIQNNVAVLISFSLFFALYNNYLSTVLFGMLDCALQNL